MPGLVHDFKVFIATPGGLDAERKAFRDVLQEFNELDPQGRRLIFTPIGWELTLGGQGRPQSLINQDLITCDYFVQVLWDRWGSPPDTAGNYSSGCEEEFKLALRCLNDPQKSMREVVVFFKDVDDTRKRDPGPQLSKVLEFRNELARNKHHLYMTFSETSSFQVYLRRFLARWARDHIVPPSEYLEVLGQSVSVWNSRPHEGAQDDSSSDYSDVSGIWQGKQGKLRLECYENDVSGEYQYNSGEEYVGKLTGKIFQDRIVFHWEDKGEDGFGYWDIRGSELIGAWWFSSEARIFSYNHLIENPKKLEDLDITDKNKWLLYRWHESENG